MNCRIAPSFRRWSELRSKYRLGTMCRRNNRDGSPGNTQHFLLDRLSHVMAPSEFLPEIIHAQVFTRTVAQYID